MEITWIIGGDRRQEYLTASLRRRGWTVQHSVTMMDDDFLNRVTRVILPYPATRDGAFVSNTLGNPKAFSFAELLSKLPNGTCLLGGAIPSAWREEAEARGLSCLDYSTDALQWRNACPSAEGAIRLCMEALPVTVFGTRLGVLGFGRIGSLLTEKLTALGAKVTVYARKEESRVRASFAGAEVRTPEELPNMASDTRMLFCTVPHRILPREILQTLQKTCILMELASAPGAFDPDEAKELGFSVISAPGIPGRFYPESAGELLAQTIADFSYDP